MLVLLDRSCYGRGRLELGFLKRIRRPTLYSALPVEPTRFGGMGTSVLVLAVVVAVTYFVPVLHAEHCERTATTNEYKIAVDWERRTDTAWTIVVPGYRGAADRVPNTSLFAKPLTGYQADVATQAALSSMPKIGEHPAASMTNAGGIASVKATRDGSDVLISITLDYANDCEAETPWRIEPIVRGPDTAGVAHVFATLEPPATDKMCGEIAQRVPAQATSHLRMSAPSGARSLQLVVPNVPRANDLPVVTREVALR